MVTNDHRTDFDGVTEEFPLLEPYKPVAVIVNDTGEILAHFDAVLDAERYITGLEVIDACGVSAGKYGIDAPEEMINPIKR